MGNQQLQEKAKRQREESQRKTYLIEQRKQIQEKAKRQREESQRKTYLIEQRKQIQEKAKRQREESQRQAYLALQKRQQQQKEKEIQRKIKKQKEEIQRKENQIQQQKLFIRQQQQRAKKLQEKNRKQKQKNQRKLKQNQQQKPQKQREDQLQQIIKRIQKQESKLKAYQHKQKKILIDSVDIQEPHKIETKNQKHPHKKKGFFFQYQDQQHLVNKLVKQFEEEYVQPYHMKKTKKKTKKQTDNQIWQAQKKIQTKIQQSNEQRQHWNVLNKKSKIKIMKNSYNKVQQTKSKLEKRQQINQKKYQYNQSKIKKIQKNQQQKKLTNNKNLDKVHENNLETNYIQFKQTKFKRQNNRKSSSEESSEQQSDQDYDKFQGMNISDIFYQAENYPQNKHYRLRRMLGIYKKNLIQQIQKLRTSQQFQEKYNQCMDHIQNLLQTLNYNPKQKMHDQYDQNPFQSHQCQNEIQKKIKTILKKYFDFDCKIVDKFYNLETVFNGQKIFKQKQVKSRLFSGNYYMRFVCRSCNKKSIDEGRWTSMNGLIEISYKLVVIYSHSMELPFQIQFNAKIYSQKCMECQKYGEGFMYKTRLQYFCLKFCQKLIRIINQKRVQAPKEQAQDPFQEPDLHDHKHQLCEACKMGKCPSDRRRKCPYYGKNSDFIDYNYQNYQEQDQNDEDYYQGMDYDQSNDQNQRQ